MNDPKMDSMPRLLVTPAPERARYSFTSREQFNTWMDGRRELDFASRGNLRQMLRYDPLPKGRSAKHEVEDHFLLDEASWMYHADVGVAVPLFGLAPGKLKQWLAQYGDTVGSMSVSTFKRLLQSGKSSPSGWWCGPPPSGLADVVDGQSVLNLRADHATSAAIQLPHYTAASLEVTGFHHLRLFCATARQPLGPRSSCLAFSPRLCAGRAARTAWSRRRGRH